MKISDYSYELPEKLIAQHPPKVRGQSRLLVLDKQTGEIEHQKYADLLNYLETGDVIVLNDTKVIKARLQATNGQGRPRELLLLEDHHNADLTRRQVMYRGKIRQGEVLKVNQTEIVVESILGEGLALITSQVNLLELAETAGTVPLPPYMHRQATKEDVARYQTVFADKAGSVAAPTASLNFTHELEQKLRAKGVKIVYLTLHVGLGTFMPIRVDDITKHHMHSEYFEIPEETIETIQLAKKSGKSILAVGTTVTRSLEYCADKILNDRPKALSGEADIFIYPGYEFQVVDSLLTNFHAPKTTVLMLAAAFAGWANLKKAYLTAIQGKYSFLSYGDSTFIK